MEGRMTAVTLPPSRRSPWDRFCGAIVRRIRLNVVDVQPTLVTKRRNPFGRRILPVANWFFRWCRVPISFCADPQAWQRWEVSCYHLLNPQYHAAALGDDGVS